MNILDEREVRKIHRKLKKKEYDGLITLSAEEGTKVRLLDEGMVVRSDGSPWFYIMKGTLQKYYDALPDDYEGSINMGHMSLATFPILLGSWTKKDLTLVDIGSGRMGLDVNLHLDEENMLVKELRRTKYELAVSAEFTSVCDEKATEKYGVPMIQELFIWDFAIVGEPGNINSWVHLKGENMKFEEITALLSSAEDISAVNDVLDQALESNANPSDEGDGDGAANSPDDDGEGEPSNDGEGEPSNDGEGEPAEGDGETSEEEVTLASVMAAVNDLNSRIASLEKEKTELQAQLDAKKQAEADFVEKFKKLSISLATERREEPVVEYEASFTDGFGG